MLISMKLDYEQVVETPFLSRHGNDGAAIRFDDCVYIDVCLCVRDALPTKRLNGFG